MTNQAGRSDPGILIDEEENRNVHRIWFEICMEKLVKWVVRKSGEIISGEKIETIYKKLTNRIWAKVKDKCEEIPLKNIQKCHKMIFKAFCKEFEDAESVLQALDLNQPIVDHMIAQVFIEEAAKLSKRPCCISRFFSFVGRLFRSFLCCMQSSNTDDCDVGEQTIVFQSLIVPENKPENEKRNSSHATLCSCCNFKNCNCSVNINIKLMIPKLFTLT